MYANTIRRITSVMISILTYSVESGSLPNAKFAILLLYRERKYFVVKTLYIILSEYFAVKKISLTAKYSLTIIVWSEYFAVNKISLTAKYSLTIIVWSEYFAVNKILLTAKYSLTIMI